MAGRETRSEARGRRLDQPLDRSRTLRPAVDPDLFGRASERIARFIGSWRFILYMTVFVLTWVLWNVLAPDDLKFDPWPFIGLTLMLSLQASYAAPLTSAATRCNPGWCVRVVICLSDKRFLNALASPAPSSPASSLNTFVRSASARAPA